MGVGIMMKIFKRGDTIIEVILAVTIFSIVVVGAMTIMNSGIAMSQRSLEITQVRHQLDGQAEMLRYVRDRAGDDPVYAAMWGSITGSRQVDNPISILNVDRCPEGSAINSSPNRRFTLRPSGGRVAFSGALYSSEPATYAKVTPVRSEGISIQITEAEGGGAYDAHIQACWYGPGSSRPATIGTIVRLYDAS